MIPGFFSFLLALEDQILPRTSKTPKGRLGIILQGFRCSFKFFELCYKQQS